MKRNFVLSELAAARTERFLYLNMSEWSKYLLEFSLMFNLVYFVILLVLSYFTAIIPPLIKTRCLKYLYCILRIVSPVAQSV
jgi:hypothetical protein